MSKQSDDQQRLEQFYKLLADYGLTGRSQSLSRHNQATINELFNE